MKVNWNFKEGWGSWKKVLKIIARMLFDIDNCYCLAHHIVSLTKTLLFHFIENLPS